jgi:predicted anti-sigma-YlaC factor YlaD
MRCEIEVLSRYIDGDLSLPERRAVDAHLAECDPCRTELQALRLNDSVLISWGHHRTCLPPETEARIARSVSRGRRRSWLAGVTRVSPAAVGSLVAGVLVLISANLGVLYGNGAAGSSHVRPTGSAHVILKQSAPLASARRASALGVHARPATAHSVDHHVQFDVD